MPNAFNHVAVSVTDIVLAMRWYRDVLGMTVLMEPAEISATVSDSGDEHLSHLVRNVFGPRLGKFLICHMSSSNGVGIELFQFLEPKAERREGEGNFEYWKNGVFHIAITELDVGGLAKKIASTGGTQRTEVMALASGSDKRICFCEDPFGNIIEIYSHSYEQFWANSKV